MLYLDHNASTTIHCKVKEMLNNLMQHPYNASAIHAHGRYARELIEKAREQIANSLDIDINSKKYQIIFTSSGTESNNLLMNNYDDGEIFISSIEHLSIFDHINPFTARDICGRMLRFAGVLPILAVFHRVFIPV